MDFIFIFARYRKTTIVRTVRLVSSHQASVNDVFFRRTNRYASHLRRMPAKFSERARDLYAEKYPQRYHPIRRTYLYDKLRINGSLNRRKKSRQK